MVRQLLLGCFLLRRCGFLFIRDQATAFFYQYWPWRSLNPEPSIQELIAPPLGYIFGSLHSTAD